MSVSLESFVDGYLYPGQLMQLSGTGPSEDDNPVRYEGSCNEIPKEYLGEIGDSPFLMANTF